MRAKESKEVIRIRAARYRERMKDKGLIQLTVWIKKSKKEKIIEYIKSLP